MNIFGDLILKEPQTINLKLDSPFELFKNLYHNNTHAFLLESMESDSGMARFSVLGFQPSAIIKAHDNILEIEKNNTKISYYVENPFDEIKSSYPHPLVEKDSVADCWVRFHEAVKYFEPVEVAKSPILILTRTIFFRDSV